MNISKLVTFAFASRRRKLAMLTLVGITGIGSLVGGGDTTPAREPVAVTVTTTAVPAFAVPAAVTVATTAAPAPAVPVATKCDGVHFNVPVVAGDVRDRDGDGVACEKN